LFVKFQNFKVNVFISKFQKQNHDQVTQIKLHSHVATRCLTFASDTSTGRHADDFNGATPHADIIVVVGASSRHNRAATASSITVPEGVLQ
jgi:hypothetical protein